MIPIINRTCLVHTATDPGAPLSHDRTGLVHAATGRQQRGVWSADRGSATILAVGVVGGLAAILVAALALVSVLVAGQQARAAGDLAALAGAGQAVLGAGPAEACAAVNVVANRNGARVESCTLRAHGTQPWPRVLVTVSRQVSGTPWRVTARAAAGGASS